MKTQVYDFGITNSYLDQQGYPKVSPEGIEVIRVDFNKLFHEGKITFDEYGIYLSEGDKKWKGYMYMPDYRVTTYGYPKFHLVKCEKIQEFIAVGLFNQNYIWSNHKYNDIRDRDTGEMHKNVNLQLCGYCRKILSEMQGTTEEFYRELVKEFGLSHIQGQVAVDIFGYTLDWQRISNKYKEKQHYTCERCGIQVEASDRNYIHTHHRDGDKLNNTETNLECLCVKCHSEIDARHYENTDKIDLKNFIDKYIEPQKLFDQIL